MPNVVAELKNQRRTQMETGIDMILELQTKLPNSELGETDCDVADWCTVKLIWDRPLLMSERHIWHSLVLTLVPSLVPLPMAFSLQNQYCEDWSFRFVCLFKICREMPSFVILFKSCHLVGIFCVPRPIWKDIWSRIARVTSTCCVFKQQTSIAWLLIAKNIISAPPPQTYLIVAFPLFHDAYFMWKCRISTAIL